MATTCLTPIRGKAIRVTQVDGCGMVPEDALYGVSNGFVTATISVENESGDEIVMKTANGRLCVNAKSPDSLKRLNVTIDWCEIDPALVNLITGFREELDENGDTVGFRFVEQAYDATWAFEIWTDLAGDACTDEGQQWGYLLLPFMTGAAMGGDLTIENGAATFQTTGYSQSGSMWGEGPWLVVGSANSPTPLDDPIQGDEHGLVRTTNIPPPTGECGVFPVFGSP